MALARFEIEKIDGKGDFELWKAKIRAVLKQQKASKAILDPADLPQTITDAENETMKEIAYKTIILNLSDSILRQVIELKSAYQI